MDARPSPEQLELEAAAVRLGERLGVRTVNDLDDGDRRSRLDAAIVQAGWRELRAGTVTEPLASGVEAALVSRVLARYACDAAFVGPVLAHDLLRRAGIACDGSPTLVVERDLRGPAVGAGVAIDAAAADALVTVTPPDDDGAAKFTVGVAPTPAIGDDASTGDRGVDLTRVMRSVEVGDEARLEGHIAADDLLAWKALAVTLTAADLVGSMEAALTLSVDYARERRQYGAPIGSFQAVQHLLAEAKTLIEGAHSAMIHAAWAVDALSPDDARLAAAVAKAYAARAARTVCETAIQVHGGIGNTWECMAHVHLRRVLLSTELFGNDGVQLSLLARQRWGAVHGLS